LLCQQRCATSNHNHTDEAKDEGQPTNNLPHNLNSLLQVLFHFGWQNKKGGGEMASTNLSKRKIPPSKPSCGSSCRVKRSLLHMTPEPPPSQKPSPPEHTLSMKEQQNIEHQIQCYINAAKENEVIKHANNVVYYRDLEATFGVFGTVEQDEDYLQQETLHSTTTCLHCGEVGHCESACTLTCNSKHCHQGACRRAWYRGDQIKKYGAKHNGETYLQIFINDVAYFRWAMRQLQPALDIFSLQEWGRDCNALYKNTSDFWMLLEHPQLTVPAKPIQLKLPSTIPDSFKFRYEKIFNLSLVNCLIELNKQAQIKVERDRTLLLMEDMAMNVGTEEQHKRETKKEHQKTTNSVEKRKCERESALFCDETL
jgi:hypothetical protein